MLKSALSLLWLDGIETRCAQTVSLLSILLSFNLVAYTSHHLLLRGYAVLPLYAVLSVLIIVCASSVPEDRSWPKKAAEEERR